MQIIIPMSGFGERFRRAGYDVPKPLIEVDEKPIIAHVVDLFPEESDITFICNREHLADPAYRMAEILQRYCPTGKIIGIEPHKRGPVYAVAQIFDRIDLTKPTIVNYCDFTCYWDYTHFKQFVRRTACAGAIPAYRGFHPHSLGSTFYAYMREQNGWVLDIQEKQPFTDDPQSEFASSGTYYFASGEIMREYFQRTSDQDLRTGDEYYASLAYKPMLADKLPVAVYELQHFMQWGEPADLEEYCYWSDAFKRLAQYDVADRARQPGTVLIPMAGLGSRFVKEGYEIPKPLIPVSGKPMVVQATMDLPEAQREVFIVREEMEGAEALRKTVHAQFPNAEFVQLRGETEGQAATCLLGLEGLELDQPLTIAACDNGALYPVNSFERLLEDPDAMVLVWVAKGYPGAARNPQMYGWVDAEGHRIKAVSVKTPLGDPKNDPVIIGTFTFRHGRDFVAAAERMMAREARINGEYYVDTCINDAVALGLDCRIIEVDNYLCWGTPNDLRTFEYWQSCFHKWPSHQYRLDCDSRVASDRRLELAARYAQTQPPLPASTPPENLG